MGVFDRGDINGDEALDFNEFATMCFQWNVINEEKLTLYIHEVLVDIGGQESGQVSMDALVAYFGDAVSPSELEHLFRRMQVDTEFKAQDVVKFIRSEKK